MYLKNWFYENFDDHYKFRFQHYQIPKMDPDPWSKFKGTVSREFLICFFGFEN